MTIIVLALAYVLLGRWAPAGILASIIALLLRRLARRRKP